MPIHLTPSHRAILCDELIDWLAGIEEDLETPARLRDPESSVREAGAFRRLLVALDRGVIDLPDEDARTAMEQAAHGYDEANGYEGIVAAHDAHHALLAVLGGRR